MKAESLYQRLYKIAKKVRIWAETVNDKHGLWDDDLCRGCGVCSYIIFVRLDKLGYKPRFIWSDYGHCFIICQGFLIDVTATQFEGFEGQHIFIESSLPYYEGIIDPQYEINKEFYDISSIKDFLKYWPPGENPKQLIYKGRALCHE